MNTQYAIVNGERREPQSGLRGICQVCGDPMVAKCGDIRVHHWAHLRERNCDTWWENETEWHRNWKGHFLAEWREYVHRAENNEKHIADVKTDAGWALEFQHSFLEPAERKARNDFYPKLMWVVDGIRRQRDRQQFFDSLVEAGSFNAKFARKFYKVMLGNSALFREWGGCPVPVFFDFGDKETVWLALPYQQDAVEYVIEFSRVGFIAMHRGDSTGKDYFSDLLRNLTTAILNHNSQLLALREGQQLAMQVRHHRPRRHFRF